MFYNIHTHIFNAKAIPENFLGKGIVRLLSRNQVSFLLVLYLKRGSVFVVNLVRNIPYLGDLIGRGEQASSQIVAALDRNRLTRWLANILRWFADVPLDFLERYAAFIEAGREKSQELIFEKLKSLPCYHPETRFVVLTLNMDYMGAGRPRINFRTQLSFVDRMKKKYPNHFFPFLSIDPRSASGHELRTLAEQYLGKHGYVGIKLYPALGFYPFDPKMKVIYDYALENNIPIMTHCTQGGVYFKGKWSNDHLNPIGLDNQPLPDEYLEFRKRRNSIFKNNFTDPKNYLLVLKEYPALKICFAHYGGSGQMMEFRYRPAEKKIPDPPPTRDIEIISEYFRTEKNWYARVRYLIASFENVYTDISYSLAEDRVFSMISDDLQDEAVKRKILFGTDFYMTEQEKFETRMVTEFRKHLSDIDPDEGLFNLMAVENPMQYLKSVVFPKPPDPRT